MRISSAFPLDPRPMCTSRPCNGVRPSMAPRTSSKVARRTAAGAGPPQHGVRVDRGHWLSGAHRRRDRVEGQMARRRCRSALHFALTANDGRRAVGGRPAADLERPRSGRTGRPGRAFTCRAPGRCSRGWWGRPLRLYSSGPPRRAALSGSLPLAGAALRALRGTATRPRLLAGGVWPALGVRTGLVEWIVCPRTKGRWGSPGV
jgi:hypothetical protein